MTPIVFEDENILVVNKANGVLIHPSYYARDVKSGFLVETLAEQVGYPVYPIHRLDRKTSGLIMFAKNKTYIPQFQKIFKDNKIQKSYEALVRGHLNNPTIVDIAISDSKGVKKEAESHFSPIQNYTLATQIGKFPESWFAHIALAPKTGRFHQLRKHCNKLALPIIGDYKHGDRLYNQYFRDVFGEERMFLHAKTLVFEHPLDGSIKKIECPLPEFWEHSIQRLNIY